MHYIIKYLKNKSTDMVFVFQYYHVMRYMVSILVSIMMVRCGLLQLELGKYELWIFIATTCTFFWSAGIRNAFLSYQPGLEKRQADQLVWQVFWALTGLAAIPACLILFEMSWFISLFTAEVLLPFAPWVAVYILLAPALVLTENIFYLNKQPNRLVQYSHWSNAGYFCIFLLISLIDPVLERFIQGLVLITLIRFVYLFWLLFPLRSTKLSLKPVLTFLLFSAPLVLNMLLGSFMDFIDGWFVARYFDASYFPIFRYGARELPFSSLLFSSLSTAMIPLLIKEGLQSDVLKSKATKLMHILFPLTMLLMVLSPVIFPWIYSPQYKESAFIFNTYMLILISRVLLPQAYNFALHQHRIIILSGILEIFINIVLSFWWLQYWGMYGLAMATVVAYLVQKIFLILINKYKNQIPLHQYIDIKYYVLYSLTIMVTFIITFKYF